MDTVTISRFEYDVLRSERADYKNKYIKLKKYHDHLADTHSKFETCLSDLENAYHKIPRWIRCLFVWKYEKRYFKKK